MTSVLGYLLAVGVALSWIFLSRQKRVPRTGRTVCCISLRTLPLFLLLFVVCHRSGANAFVVVVVLTAAFWGLLLAPGALGLGAIGVFYVIQQWILGWPDRSDFVLDVPPCRKSDHMLPDDLIGKTGIARCPLRPGGVVVLGEQEYPALSDLGYVDRGTRVMITGRKNGVLVVRPAPVEPASNDRVQRDRGGRDDH